MLESIKLAGETLGAGVKEFLSDQQKMAAAATTITAVALGIYSAKVSGGGKGRGAGRNTIVGIGNNDNNNIIDKFTERPARVWFFLPRRRTRLSSFFPSEPFCVLFVLF